CHYFVSKEGEKQFGFKRSQHSYIEYISNFYSLFFAQNELNIFNANQHMTELSSFGYLVKTKPDFYKTLVMCESTVNPNEKWCCSCSKCGEFVLYSMYYNLKQNDIDMDWFFSESKWIKKIIEKISLQPKGSFIQGSTFFLHFDSFKFILNSLYERKVSFKSEQAQINFNLLVDFYREDANLFHEDCFYYDILKKIYPSSLYQYSIKQLSRILPSKIAPKEKKAGNEVVYFNKNVLPIIKEIKGIIDPMFFSQRLISNRMGVNNLQSSPRRIYVENVDFQLINSLTEKDIAYTLNNKMLDFYFIKNPLLKGDGCKIILNIPSYLNYSVLCFKLNIPYCSEKLEERFDVYLSVNDKTEKINMGDNKNILFK
ncbi:hypothetical protein, partial [Basilea psittacipulmonis]